MRTLRQFIFIVIFVLSWCIAAESTIARTATGALPSSVEVFTTQNERPTRRQSQKQAEIRVFVLDGIQQLEATLSHSLPADRAMAQRVVLNRLQRLNGEWQKSVKASAEALMRAQELGVQRYPAIVFNEKWVVYGLTDLDAAIVHYHGWRGGKGT